MRRTFHAVLEGPDGAGKTTLAGALRARYGAEIVHNGPPSDGSTAASLTREYAADVAMPNPGGLIVDRWALGETVYGPLFRGQSLIGPLEWRALVGLLDATRTPLVVCLPPRDVCLANWQRNLERETFKDREAMLRVYDAYASWALGGASPYARPRWTWVYDYCRLDEPGLHQFLDDLGKHR